ncbi:hypothetical protein [Parafrankia colletiae]|nr:hypothetical protein [Parafrankia colletiae]
MTSRKDPRAEIDGASYLRFIMASSFQDRDLFGGRLVETASRPLA